MTLRGNLKDYLFVSDLDGTLLDPESRLSGNAAARLNRLIDQGLNFSIATARTYDSAHPLLKEVNLQLPVILFNGVFLTEFHTGHNLVSTNFISRDVVHGVMEVLHPRGMDPFIYTHGDESRVLYRAATNEGVHGYLEHLEGDRRLCAVEHYEFLDGEQIAGFLVIDQPKRLDPVFETLSGQFPEDLNLYYAKDISNPDFFWLQAFHKQADKGSMLTRLANQCGFLLSNTVVFGDYLNDLEMFEVAGHSCAMANALPEVQKRADQIIGSNAENGVLTYLESLEI